jgi:hypothetical protein
MAAEMALIRIEFGDVGAFLRREKIGEDSAAVAVEFAGELLPVIGRNPCLCRCIRR